MRPKKTLLLIAGTHGNEISGSVYFEKNLKYYKDYVYEYNLTIIPKVNDWGIRNRIRYLPKFPVLTDINRIYYTDKDHDFVKGYIKYINNANLVVDFHDAWGFQSVDDSVGSGLYPNFVGDSEYYSKRMVNNLNKNIDAQYMKFVSKQLDDVYGTLHNYCKHNKIPYILVETSGQNDVLPLETRLLQIDVLVNTLLKIF